MKRLATIAFALVAVLALAKCGSKKEDEPAPPPVAVGKMSVTCGGFSCVGTEAK